VSEIDEVDGLGSLPHGYYEREEPLTGIVMLPSQERHDTGEHPENARRLPAVVDYLRATPDWEKLFVLYPRYARIEDALRSHDAGFVELLQAAADDAPVWLDTDTRVSRDSFRSALLSSGAVMSAVDAVAMEAYHRPDSLLALVRPPGHHSGPDKAMGFCLLNHASIAARYAQEQYGFERIAILDWDVHHGNGTQDIHYDDPSVLFVSLHQWPLYPGTGAADEVGCGDGEGMTVNIPMPPGCRDAEYLEAFDRIALPVIAAHAPQLLIVSAGQDCHAADTLSNQLVSASGFRAMAERVSALAKELRIGLVLINEGGYNVSVLPRLVHSILGGLGDFQTDDREDIFVPAEAQAPAEWEGLMRETLGIQRRYWPDLA
jgi:acetoin utilization deacetylase AcuC-like enzyme